VRARRLGGGLASLLLVAGGVALLPRVAGSSWLAISSALRQVTWWQVTGVVLLWVTSLVVHTLMLSAALPGLSHRRALTLNLTGSAVGNVVPLGGGMGVGLNFFMVRQWGFTAGQFSLYTGLTNVLHVLVKGLLPVVGVALLLLGDATVGRQLALVAVTTSVVLLGLVGITALALGCEAVPRRLGPTADRLVRLAHRGRDGTSVATRLSRARTALLVILRAGWPRLTIGLVGYYGLGALLMWACLRMPGAHVGLATATALFALERALTTLPLTPGGVGVVELVTTTVAATLVSPADVAPLAAGILLYRGLVFGLEIPVGMVWLAGWLLMRWRQGRSRAVVAAVPAEAL
jgi:uncharacterized membrane protein YbhN (UPF0104 family)